MPVDPREGPRFCIDQRTVTQAEYFEFVRAQGADPTVPYTSIDDRPKGQIEECNANRSWIPTNAENHGSNCDPSAEPGYGLPPEAFDWTEKHPDHPVGCVDWCDAVAYCAWAGKRLCGQIGGGALSAADKNNAERNEWLHACNVGVADKMIGPDAQKEWLSGVLLSAGGAACTEFLEMLRSDRGSTYGIRCCADPF